MEFGVANDFILIEYPGVVKNIENAMKTLGGIDAIAAASFTSQPLELRYQVDNPYQCALPAEKRVDGGDVNSGQMRLVLRIRRLKRRKGRTDDGVADPEGPTTSAATNNDFGLIKHVKCLGLVTTVFTFRSMCDFAYLPLRRLRDEDNVFEDLVPKLVPTSFAAALSWWEKTLPYRAMLAEGSSFSGGTSFGVGVDAYAMMRAATTPHFLPPSMFSRYTNSSTKIVGNMLSGAAESGGVSEGEDSLTQAAQSSTLIGHAKNLRKERQSLTLNVLGHAAFPEVPSALAVAEVDLRIKNRDLHATMEQVFAERPMWTRVALLQKTGMEDSTLKTILAKYAFYIVSGPWGRLWCKYGYNPRKDPSAKQYQTVMVSFRQHKNIPERHRLKMSIGASTTPAGTMSFREFHQLLDFTYRPGVLPPVRQMWYCVCDIHLAAAQKVLKKDFFAVLKECHETNGWLPPEIIGQIRKAIKEDVKRVSDLMQMSADELLDPMSDNVSLMGDYPAKMANSSRRTGGLGTSMLNATADSDDPMDDFLGADDDYASGEWDYQDDA